MPRIPSIIRAQRALQAIVGAVFLLGSMLAVAPVLAQQMQPPPRRDAKTPTGVSFRGGGFSIQEEDLAIGDGANGLRVVRSYNSTTDGISDPYFAAVGWTQTLNVYVASQTLLEEPDFLPPPNYRGKCVYNVVGGSGAEGFIYNGPFVPQQNSCGGAQVGNYVPITPGGAKLEYLNSAAPNFYRYTGADGTVINFIGGANRASNWTKPDGTRLDFTYVSGTLKSVFSSRGWAILYESATKICAVNLAQTYVTPTSVCPAGVQTVTYAYSPGTYVTSRRLMTTATKNGAARTYQYASNNHVNCVKDPGQTICRIQNTYGHCLEDPLAPFSIQPNMRMRDPVLSQTDGSGRTYTYSYSIDQGGFYAPNLCPQWIANTDPDMRPYNPMTTTVTESGVPGSTIAITDTASQVTAFTDPLSRTTGLGYDGSVDYIYESGDPNEVLLPEGNSEGFFKDARGNITAKVVKAKPGTGLADLFITAVYPSTCGNIKTCNKPTSATDPKGNTTDFTYDAAHGGVLTETGPTDASSIRPVKRNAYVQRSAWLKNSSGGYTASAYPVWLLSEMRICRTSATVGNTCAAGVTDEVVTAYDYGPNTGPNNLLVRGQTVTANGVTLRTCFSYDRDGRKISETSPNANLSACP